MLTSMLNICFTIIACSELFCGSLPVPYRKHHLVPLRREGQSASRGGQGPALLCLQGVLTGGGMSKVII